MKKLVVLVIILATVGFGCQKTQNQSVPGETATIYMNFTVDKSLLGPAWTAPTLGIGFNPPVDWRVGADSLRQQVKEIIHDPGYATTPLILFYNDSLQCGCLISEVDSLPVGNTDLIFDLNMNSFHVIDSTITVQNTEFQTDFFRVRQTLALTESIVYFRLLFDREAEQMFQIDYIVPKIIYPSQVKAIESSLGSVRLLKYN